MKKNIIVYLAAALLTGNILMADCDHCGGVVPLSEVSGETFTAFLKGDLNKTILECAENTYLPFKITVKGDFLDLTSVSLAGIKVIKTCYARCEKENEVLFSTDLVTWKSFSDFFTGKIESTVKVEDETLVTGLEIELNQR
ncbi:MAG TPA: hypothetical protein VLG76_01135 [Rhabdochlamydiaceae bacterium]|nr:hypothetical protein [Rhabdochlamydiaceae bacterium]